MRKHYECENVTAEQRQLAATASRRYRRELGLTQCDLADRLRTTQPVISWMEKGHSTCPGRVILQLLNLAGEF